MQVGSKVKIFITEGSYIGIVQSISQKSNQITFEKLRCCKDDKYYGVLSFLRDEIEKYEILEEESSQLSNRKTSPRIVDEPGSNFLKANSVPKHLIEQNVVSNRSLALFSQGFHTDVSHFYGVGKASNEIDFSTLKFSVPGSHHMISNVTDLDNALGHIEEQRLIGIAIEGNCYKRDGTLYLIQVATKNHVFLFDLMTLNNEIFDRGLRNILQSPSIQKVIHDSRMVSDVFYHQYHTHLVNVFDTQVADAFLKKEVTNEFSRYVSSLPRCIMNHLNLSPDYVYIQRIREDFIEQDLSIWKQRPLPQSLFFAAIKEVIYLIKLKFVLADKMMESFRVGVDIYLSDIRDCSDEERPLCQVSPHLLPQMFTRLVGNCKGPHDIVSKDFNGFKETKNKLEDPDVIFNRDIWHWRNKKSPSSATISKNCTRIDETPKTKGTIEISKRRSLIQGSNSNNDVQINSNPQFLENYSNISQHKESSFKRREFIHNKEEIEIPSNNINDSVHKLQINTEKRPVSYSKEDYSTAEVKNGFKNYNKPPLLEICDQVLDRQGISFKPAKRLISHGKSVENKFQKPVCLSNFKSSSDNLDSLNSSSDSGTTSSNDDSNEFGAKKVVWPTMQRIPKNVSFKPAG